MDAGLGVALATGEARAIEEYLIANSHLHGARLNLRLVGEFADAVAQAESLLPGWIELSPDDAPDNDPRVILPCAAAVGYGELAATQPERFEETDDRLYRAASGSRWRVREAVTLGLQRMLQVGVGYIEPGGEQAVDRLAEAALLGVRITNEPLYRLLEIDLRGGAIFGRVGLTHFGAYALTMDLLEREIADALAGGSRARRGEPPLRDRYLPDLAAVFDLEGRLCAGGVVALCAIARPADTYRGEARLCVACSTDSLSGEDWDDLTGLLAARTAAFCLAGCEPRWRTGFWSRCWWRVVGRDCSGMKPSGGCSPIRLASWPRSTRVRRRQPIRGIR